MSLIIDKDNIFFMMPNSRYTPSHRVDTIMDDDFTIFVRAKVLKDTMVYNQEAFILARNGQHTGISVVMNELNQLIVKLGYWFINTTGDVIHRQAFYQLPTTIENEFNDYIVVCDNSAKIMTLYVNGVDVSNIDYNDVKKRDYINTFIWLGCGSMIVDSDFKNIGKFEYNLLMISNNVIEIDTILDITTNYHLKYLTDDVYYELPVLSNKTPHIENIKVFTNFDYRSNYKIWNMAGTYNYFQLYIDGNINF